MASGARTTRRRRVSYPVANLRGEVSGLETVMAQVMARPRKEAVHRLRSTTRRIEAHLEVVEELAHRDSGFRVVVGEMPRVRKLLHRVRRAAGRVRDVDVARERAKEFTAGEVAPGIRREAGDLRKKLKGERKREGQDLLALLKGPGLKLQPSLEQLVDALEPVSEVGMSAVELEALTRAWYERQLKAAGLEKRQVNRMHWIRKSAKLARYMAETGLAARVVREFATVQTAGGQWHDCLNLLDMARERLGKRSELVLLLDKREAAACSAFEAQLSRWLPCWHGVGGRVEKGLSDSLQCANAGSLRLLLRASQFEPSA